MNTEVSTEASRSDFWNTKRLVRMALFVALGTVGGLIPLPSPTGTVGLDSAPGYFLALFAGGVEGGIVLGIGHLVSGIKAGFPLGPIHLPIAIGMAVCGWLFWYVNQRFNLTTAGLVATLFNGVILNLLLIPLLGVGFFMGMTPVLLIASAVNIVIAIAVYRFLDNR
ncbi:ECF transporter S component [Natroniella sulfidigena]|uniref:ECF transporter S component n=1 Tax=Natroniella sulfidigena TaxID=723921 RepID=UPI00200A3183|nr:ECF transporter S component [Natroniella sulfidigena]MCK8817348.1 ECF transporter S component [Natroniella sulfidigena]